MTLTICGPGRNGEPAAEVLTAVDAGVRWCFVERAHRAFVDQLVGTREPSWWEPVWTRRCASCNGIDTDLGFGRERWSE